VAPSRHRGKKEIADMFQCTGFAARSANEPLAGFSFNRRDPGPKDVKIEILYCGVCHSDLHQARDEWHSTVYPCLPGHEIVDRVTKTGAEATLFKTGDLAVSAARSIPAALAVPAARAWNNIANGASTQPTTASTK
jgi:D-arabinose 1-dehydrogenase-like Zn-dependent alcohol dehydrogenase